MTEVAVAPVVLSVPTTSGNTWLTTDHTISNVAVLFGSDKASDVNARDVVGCICSQRHTDNDRPSTTLASLCLICNPARWNSASEISDNNPARSAQSTATRMIRSVWKASRVTITRAGLGPGSTSTLPSIWSAMQFNICNRSTQTSEVVFEVEVICSDFAPVTALFASETFPVTSKFSVVNISKPWVSQNALKFSTLPVKYNSSPTLTTKSGDTARWILPVVARRTFTRYIPALLFKPDRFTVRPAAGLQDATRAPINKSSYSPVVNLTCPPLILFLPPGNINGPQHKI